MRNSAWRAPSGEKQRKAFVRGVDTAVGWTVKVYRKIKSSSLISKSFFISICSILSSYNSELESEFIVFTSPEEILSSFPFVPNDSSKAAFYCSSIYINSNGTIVLVHSNVTNTINMWSSLNLRSNKKHRAISSRRDISCILAWSIVWTYCEFSGQETSSLFQTEQQNGTRLYLREVIPLIYKTPKQSFLPLHFPGAIPFKRTRSFILGSHAHTGPVEK